jgi:hypothetical protein
VRTERPFFCLLTGIIGGILRFWGRKVAPLTGLDKTLNESHSGESLASTPLAVGR